MTEPAIPVRPLLRILANGKRQGKDKTYLKFTLIATPEYCKDLKAAQGAVEFSNWPAAVAEMIWKGHAPFAKGGGLTMHVRNITAEKIPSVGSGNWCPLSINASAASAFADTTRWQRISKLWQGALGDVTSPLWLQLAQDIARSLDGAKRTSDLKATYGGDPELAKKDGAIIFQPPTADQTATIKGVLPVRQSDFAIEEEGIRAARVLAKQYRGAFVVDDETYEPEILEQRFDAATGNTNPERAGTLAASLEVTALVAPGRVTDVQLSSAKTAAEVAAPPPSVVPAANDVVYAPETAPNASPTGDAATQKKVATDRDKRRATHVYGTWLQRQPPAAPGKIADDKPAGDAFDRMRGIYFSLQGDPILSRLFGLAFDFEIPEVIVRAQCNGEGRSSKVHLAIAPSTDKCTRATVATAAEYDAAQGFWPISAFEAHVAETKPGSNTYVVLDQPGRAEQKHGVWKLGATISVTGTETPKPESGAAAQGQGTATTVTIPRYDLASLDLRRSVDSKTAGRDRGEAHQTGGFTILDRGRADQIARDLALASFQAERLKDADQVVVLHAEELTIGRHVDVAAAKPGAATQDLQWRSLMNRFVDFDFDKADADAEKILDQLFAGKKTPKGVLEEVSFQVAARFMPASDSGAVFEAIAEEAIYLWDGTPAGVLTDSGIGNEVRPSLLPFSRKLDLPELGKDGVSLAAPLRFGIPYLFRFRSMFLGGGSPGPADPQTTSSTTAESMLPAGVDDIALPRRFLRHERIAAPVLMLPKHLASDRMAQMGYEQADQAIIRSWNGDPSGGDILGDDAPINGTYIDRTARTQPLETMRVFVAPEAAIELAVRHGMLDRGDAMTIRKGGLNDVAYTPARPLPGAPVEPGTVKPNGFPVAITSRRDTFDPEGAIYRRTVAAAEDSSARGVPVFEPGGVNTTKKGAVGYLPDPAIETYCIRARIRGSDRYLEGFIPVPLYETGTAFPNALPLALIVRKAGSNAKQVRDKHPLKIADIASLPTATWIDKGGTPSPKKPASGARVQLVRVTIYPGEDFDLEVSCLPGVAMLEKQFSLPETIAIQLGCGGADTSALERLKTICGNAVAELCKANTPQNLTGLGGAMVPDAQTVHDVATQLLIAMRSKWPIEEIAGVTTLRVCHAVNKPALMAAWKDTPVSYRTSKTIPCPEILAPKLENLSDATGLLLDGTVQLDLGLVGSFHIVAETVAADNSQLDRRERGRSMISKRSGRWPILIREDGSEAYVSPKDVVGFKVSHDGTVELPRKTVTLLSVGNLPGHGAIGKILNLKENEKGVCVAVPGTGGKAVLTPTEGRLTSVAIAPIFAAAAAGAPIVHEIGIQADATDALKRTRRLQIERPHVFKDTLARKLKLMLVSVSRFAAAFETAPAYFNGKEQTLYRRQPLKRADQAVLNSQSVEVWMKSTRRPATPAVSRPEPSFVIERSSSVSEDGKTTHSLVRRALTRLYFGRGWFSSGEGERVGIVLWPPKYNELTDENVDNDKIAFDGRELKLVSFEDADLGAGGAFVTRWGGDPIREDKSPQSGNFVPPHAFADLDHQGRLPHRPKFEAYARMPVTLSTRKDSQAAGDAEATITYLSVSLLTYEPCFDLDREEWYVDVDLKPIRASEPFVRFGLVRYQKETISDELMTSEPVTVTMQLLPERCVDISERKLPKSEDRSVCVKVKGLGSVDIDELSPALLQGSAEQKEKWQANFDGLRRPKVRLALFHETEDAERRVIRTPLNPVGLPAPDSEEDWQSELPSPKLENTTLAWSAEFNLPRSDLDDLGPGKIVAYLEEVDRRMPASYRKEPISPEKMFDQKTFINSGPRFSARMAFLQT